MFIRTTTLTDYGTDSARAIVCPVCGCKAYELIYFTKRRVQYSQVAAFSRLYNVGEIDDHKTTVRICPFEFDSQHKLLEKGYYVGEKVAEVKRGLVEFQLANPFYNSPGPILENIGISLNLTEETIENVGLEGLTYILIRKHSTSIFYDLVFDEITEKLKKLFRDLEETKNWTADQIYMDAKGATK